MRFHTCRELLLRLLFDDSSTWSVRRNLQIQNFVHLWFLNQLNSLCCARMTRNVRWRCHSFFRAIQCILLQTEVCILGVPLDPFTLNASRVRVLVAFSLRGASCLVHKFGTGLLRFRIGSWCCGAPGTLFVAARTWFRLSESRLA